MAKRFTDTAKWKKGFIKSLPIKYKLLWFYILDDCDHAGVWEVDMDVASIRIGEDLNVDVAAELLAEQIVIVGRNKWWIRDFIGFQYGTLTPKNKMYEPVMSILRKLQIDSIFLDYQEKGDKSPIYGVKVTVKEKVEVKDENKIESPAEEVVVILRPETFEGETIDEKLSAALDDLYIDGQRGKWSHINFDFELQTFIEKVRGSPGEYLNRTTDKLRLAFQYQLRNAKHLKPNGQANTRKEQHTNSLAKGWAERHSGKSSD